VTTPVFPRPALPDLISRVIGQIFAALPGTDPQLTPSTVGVIGAVLARELMNEYAYLDFIATQSFASTATGIYLDRKGNDVGIYREQPVAAAGPVIFTGVATSPIPAGTVVTTGDSSQSYVLGSAVTLVSGTGTGTVVAAVGGSAGNQIAGTPLTLSVAIAGVNAQVTVGSDGLVGGIDIESDTAFRVRVLERLQQPPQGGAKRDYVTWVQDATPGVTRVWVWPQNRGGGTVDYSFVFDGRAPGSILPVSGDLTTVQAYVNAEMPADVASSQNQTLTIDSINVTLTNFVVETGYTKAQAVANVTASLDNLFASTTPGGAPYGSGIPNGSTGGTLALELISDAITQSLGVGTFDLTAPTADVVSAEYHLAQLGTLSVSP
jgi:uncharacterized phage protein gp47/JayE